MFLQISNARLDRAGIEYYGLFLGERGLIGYRQLKGDVVGNVFSDVIWSFKKEAYLFIKFALADMTFTVDQPAKKRFSAASCAEVSSRWTMWLSMRSGLVMQGENCANNLLT